MDLELDHEVFTSAIADVREVAADLRQQRTEVAGRVRDFLSSGWEGDAAEAFAGGWEEWEQGADDVLGGLVAMAALLEATHRDLTAQDAGSQAALDALSARLVERLG